MMDDVIERFEQFKIKKIKSVLLNAFRIANRYDCVFHEVLDVVR